MTNVREYWQIFAQDSKKAAPYPMGSHCTSLEQAKRIAGSYRNGQRKNWAGKFTIRRYVVQEFIEEYP